MVSTFVGMGERKTKRISVVLLAIALNRISVLSMRLAMT
jgi:hypothetical protein